MNMLLLNNQYSIHLSIAYLDSSNILIKISQLHRFFTTQYSLYASLLHPPCCYSIIYIVLNSCIFINYLSKISKSFALRYLLAIKSYSLFIFFLLLLNFFFFIFLINNGLVLIKSPGTLGV